MIHAPARARQDRLRRRLRRPGSRPGLDPTRPLAKPAAIRGRERAEAHPKPRRQRLAIPDRTACDSPADTGKAVLDRTSVTVGYDGQF